MKLHNSLKIISLLLCLVINLFVNAKEYNFNQALEKFNSLGYKYIIKETPKNDTRTRRGMLTEYVVLKQIPLNPFDTKLYFQLTCFGTNIDAENEVNYYKNNKAKELPITNIGKCNLIHPDNTLLELLKGFKDTDLLKVIDSQKNIISGRMAKHLNIFYINKPSLIAHKSTNTTTTPKRLMQTIERMLNLIDEEKYKIVISDYLDIDSFGINNPNSVPPAMLKFIRFHLYILKDKNINPSIKNNNSLAVFDSSIFKKPIKFVFVGNRWVMKGK